MRNIYLLEKCKCTGCSLCSNICPVNAIEMKSNFEGFLEPVINENKCINCGLCMSKCPQLCAAKDFNKVEHAYAMICTDNIRKNCSSGGVFGAIARWAIDNEGTVFGARFSEDFRRVLHAKAQNEDELIKLYKSKYLQSDIGTVYSDVKENLQSMLNPVVFCGCPCQVDALKKYLGTDYDNLITIDIMCHGVVSPEAYGKFLNEIFGDVESPIKNVDFRSKKLGWACNVVVTAEDGTERISPYHGSYFDAFLWGYSQRKACFNCKYAQKERVGDITIGDFWGIDSILPEMNDKKGTSLVLTNTDKGEETLKAIRKYILKMEECDYNDVIKVAQDVNWAIVKPGIIPKTRDSFFYRLSKGDSFSQALRYASSPQYDVGIFGWWFEDEWTNYGSTLTYYALMEYVSSLELSVCMLTSPFHDRSKASKFIQEHGYMMSPTYSFEDFNKHNENINTFLIGSDQLWFYECYKPWGHSLFLDFAADEKKKISYATSFGHRDPHIPQNEIPELKKLFRRFDAISTRENDGVEIFAEKFDVKAVQNVDPVFLCDMKNWDQIAKDAERKTQGDFLFSYMLDPTEEKISALKYMAKKMDFKMISITDKQYNKVEKQNMLEDCGILRDASINELIYHLLNAKYIITDSYHGTCFALIFRKAFTSIVNKTRGVSRFDTLNDLFGIGDRYVYNAAEIVEKEYLLERLDYSNISQLIKKATDRSKAWLNNVLLQEKREIVNHEVCTKQIIKEEHQRIIRDFEILSHCGYSVGRYLKDNKINAISIYCEEKYLDIFEKLLMSLQFDDCITVEGYYSEQAFEFNYGQQSINFGIANFKSGLPQKGNLVYVSDKIESFIAPGCTVMNLLPLLWKAVAYVSVYRPLVHFKNIHPDVNVICVNYPHFPADGRRDVRETIIDNNKTDYHLEKIQRKLPETFAVYGTDKTHEDWCEVFGFCDSKMGIDGKRHYTDYSGKLKNIVDGHRVTLGQPEGYSKTVFMLGGCMTFGYGCADSETSASYIQQMMNNANQNIRIENYGAFLNYRRKDLYQILFDLPVRSNDIVIVEVWSEVPEICKKYFDYINLREIFFRPHDYGDVFVDYCNLSHLGQKAVAIKIYEYIKNKNFYRRTDRSVVLDDIKIEPMNLFGIPKNIINVKNECEKSALL